MGNGGVEVEAKNNEEECGQPAVHGEKIEGACQP